MSRGAVIACIVAPRDTASRVSYATRACIGALLSIIKKRTQTQGSAGFVFRATSVAPLHRVPWPRNSVYRGAAVGVSGRRYITQRGVREHSKAVESVRKCMGARGGA